MGAMQAAIKEWMDEIQEKSKDINKNENKEDRDREINKLFEDDPIIFLNRHDVSHTKKVMDRALELIKCFKATPHRRNLSGIVENMIRFTYE